MKKTDGDFCFYFVLGVVANMLASVLLRPFGIYVEPTVHSVIISGVILSVLRLAMLAPGIVGKTVRISVIDGSSFIAIGILMGTLIAFTFEEISLPILFASVLAVVGIFAFFRAARLVGNYLEQKTKWKVP